MSGEAVLHKNDGVPPSEEELVRQLEAEGLGETSRWGNAPGDTYAWHQHDYEKVLYCVRGGIVFHTDGADLELGPGDRLVLPPGTRHAATVGPRGVRCIEAPRYSV